MGKKKPDKNNENLILKAISPVLLLDRTCPVLFSSKMRRFAEQNRILFAVAVAVAVAAEGNKLKLAAIRDCFTKKL